MSLILVSNPDKKLNETWTPDRDIGNIPCPSRICILGSPNSGKSTMILNFLLKASPPYQKIFLIHPALQSTLSSKNEPLDGGEEDDIVNEYKYVDYIPLYSLPKPKFFDNKCTKQVLIIDDMNLKNLDKEQNRNLSKIISYSSSHYNLTIMIATQDSFSSLSVSVLRFCNVFVLYRFTDLCYLKMLFSRVGLSKKYQDKLLDEMKDYGLHDFLMIDKTSNSPAPFRRNMYHILQNFLTNP